MSLSTSAYWENYYKSGKELQRLTPSQFCVFSAGEIEGNNFVIDVGCGNGRDALYLSYLGHSVVGVDQSQTAIDYCHRANTNLALECQFETMSINNLDLNYLIEKYNHNNLDVAIYSRFFLHAITDAEEDIFLSSCLKQPKVKKVFVEFRTLRDRALDKQTESHYRRFINPCSVTSKLENDDFSVSYYVEGFGFAKYRNDDAYVARCISTRR